MTERGYHIGHLLFFRPYGSSLITPGARLWLTTTWVMALLIAGIEAWVVVTLLEQLEARLWVRICAASAVGAALFLIDASFVLLDTTSTSPTFEGRRGTPWGQRLRLLVAVTVRAALFLITLLITIPVASLALLDDELASEQQQDWHQRVMAAQEAQEHRLETDLADVRGRLSRVRQQWTDEVNAANSPDVSGRAGVGARARKYERDQRLLEQEVKTAQGRLDEYRARMAELNTEERAAELGIELPRLTFAERSAILERISDRPGVQQKTLLVKAYLLMAFGAVVLLKLLSPTAVSTYLSEEVQEARRRAASGGYDHLLRYGAEGIVPAELGPVDFRHWYAAVLPELRRRKEAIAGVHESRASLEAHRGALDYAVAATVLVADQEELAREQLARAQLDVTRLQRQVQRQQQRLATTADQEDELATATDPNMVLAYEALMERRADQEDELVAREAQLSVAVQHLDARKADLERAQQRRTIADKREHVLRESVAEIEESHLQKITHAAKGMGEGAMFGPAVLDPVAMGLSPEEQASRGLHSDRRPLIGQETVGEDEPKTVRLLAPPPAQPEARTSSGEGDRDTLTVSPTSAPQREATVPAPPGAMEIAAPTATVAAPSPAAPLPESVPAPRPKPAARRESTTPKPAARRDRESAAPKPAARRDRESAAPKPAARRESTAEMSAPRRESTPPKPATKRAATLPIAQRPRTQVEAVSYGSDATIDIDVDHLQAGESLTDLTMDLDLDRLQLGDSLTDLTPDKIPAGVVAQDTAPAPTPFAKHSAIPDKGSSKNQPPSLASSKRRKKGSGDSEDSFFAAMAALKAEVAERNRREAAAAAEAEKEERRRSRPKGVRAKKTTSSAPPVPPAQESKRSRQR